MGSGIHKVGVLGMGLMGSGIAQVAATRNFDTVVTDVSPEIVGKGMERIRDSLKLLANSATSCLICRKSGGSAGRSRTGPSPLGPGGAFGFGSSPAAA